MDFPLILIILINDLKKSVYQRSKNSVTLGKIANFKNFLDVKYKIKYKKIK